nr:hypothetical protein [Tanacetum cinerariifolium]
MEKTQNKPKEILPYGMLLTRLFKHVVSIFPELAIDHYLLCDRVLHPLTPHYEQKMQSDHGKKRPRDSNASSSSTSLNNPSSSLPLDEIVDENDEDSFCSNSSSPSQNVSSSSSVVSRVKAEHQRPSGLLQQLEIPVWKWEGIATDFVTKLPRTSSGHDTIWVIMDRLTKSAHSLPTQLFSDYDYKICYHPGKANMVADALSRKERVNPKRVRAMNMTLQSSIKDRILTDQKETVDESIRLQKDNAAKDENRKCWPACCRITMRGTGVWVGRGGRGRRPREGNDERVDDLNGQGNDQGCSYKEFLACNPKEYNRNGGAVVLTRWIKKMENVQDMSSRSIDPKVKYTAGSFVGKALTWWNSYIRTLSQEVAKLSCGITPWGAGHVAYTDRFHELARLVPHLVTPESRKIERYVYGLALQICRMVVAMEPKTMQKAAQIFSALTNEAVRNGSINKVEKRGNVGEPSKDKNGRDDNKRTTTENVFATTVNLVGRGNVGEPSKDKNGTKCATYNSYHAPGGPCHTFFNCNHMGHLKETRGHGHRNQWNQARGRAFMLGAQEARQDLNIVTSTFTLNDHFATTLFDSGADYSFVSTTFIPLLGIEPSELGFRYEIEIASGQLVEIDKVIKGCKLDVFDIDLITFRYGSFDVIIGMNWFSNYKAEIIFHERVLRIPLPDGNVLRVLGERPKEKVRFFIGVKKQEEIIVVRDFPKVCSDDLSGLPPIQEIKFQIELIPRATPVTKSPYCLAPFELEELSGQLKELQDKGFIRPSLSPWRAPIEVQFLGHVINGNGIHVDPSKIKAVKNWKAPRTSNEKCKTFNWGKKHELTFQTLTDKLCNAPILALLDGPKDFVVYCDASGIGLGCVLMQRGKIELFSEYDSEICYHPSKANVVVDALSRKERVKPKRGRAINMILQSSIKDRILATQKELWMSLQDCREEGIAMDFVTKFPRTSSGHDTIWVIVDQLTKSAHFLTMHEEYKMDRLVRLYLNEIVARHGVSISIISDRNSRFTSMFWQSMQEALGTRLDMSTTYHPRIDGQSERTIQTLEDMLIACVLDFGGSWDVHLPLAEVREGQLIEPELVQETTKKISQIKDRLKAMRDYQKIYADKRWNPLEFGVGHGAYRLDLPKELNALHNTFHVSNLKKCLAGPTLQVPLDEIRVDAKLNFVEEPVEILEREFKKLKQSRIAIINVRQKSKRGPEFTHSSSFSITTHSHYHLHSHHQRLAQTTIQTSLKNQECRILWGFLVQTRASREEEERVFAFSICGAKRVPGVVGGSLMFSYCWSAPGQVSGGDFSSRPVPVMPQAVLKRRPLASFATSRVKIDGVVSKFVLGVAVDLKWLHGRISIPTTLREAFSLARITEARFEDERSTIAIIKPNELTIRVHVQDLEQTAQGRGDEPNHILLVMIHHMIYPITVEVLHQVFSPLGYVKKVIIFHKSAGFQALIQFQSRKNAIAARNSLQEADNTKPPLFTDTFGNNGGDSQKLQVVTCLPEEFQEGDMADALSRVLEQKSLENYKELDNELKDRKVERDAEKEGEPNILKVVLKEWGVLRPWFIVYYVLDMCLSPIRKVSKVNVRVS